MLNESRENSKSSRSMENSESVSLKKKSEREDLYFKPQRKERTRNNNKLLNSQSSLKELIQKNTNSNIKINNKNKENEMMIETSDTNNIRNIRPYNKDQNIISEDIHEFQQKTECTYYQYGNFPVYQKVFFCDFCDTNSTEKICENCYFFVSQFL